MLWLWHRPAAAAPIRILAWEPPYTTGEALKRPKKKKITASAKEQKVPSKMNQWFMPFLVYYVIHALGRD